MYFKLGISAVVGGLLIVLAAPVQIFVGRGMSQMQKKVMVGSKRNTILILLRNSHLGAFATCVDECLSVHPSYMIPVSTIY